MKAFIASWIYTNLHCELKCYYMYLRPKEISPVWDFEIKFLFVSEFQKFLNQPNKATLWLDAQINYSLYPTK